MDGGPPRNFRLAFLEYWEKQQEKEEQRHKEMLAREADARREARNALVEARKSHRDWTAIVIAVLAAAFTGWQGYEAHRARVESNAAAQQARIDSRSDLAQAREEADKRFVRARADAKESMDKQLQAASELRDQAKRSASAAEQTAKTAAQQLEVADRPWVSIDMSVIGPLTFDTNGVNLKTLMTLRNSGHSPAAGLWILGELLSMAATDLTVERDRLCEEAKAQATTNPRMATTLFPTSDYNREWIFTSGKESLENAIKANHGIIVPALIVCVAYRPAFSKSVHETARIYWVMDANDPRNPQNTLAVITDGSTPIPAGRLRLMVVDLGGIYAD